ncbi:MAG: FKBP-type peptidyl-prolyl cis-trans isomerase [Actinomycetota bacterium]
MTRHKKAGPISTPGAAPSKVTGPPHKTPSGAEYWDIKVGKGEEATKGTTVSILYVGWLADGKKFGAKDDPDVPLELTIGNGRQIKGWDEGMVGMRVGGKRQLRIPSSAAYGSRGAPPVIPPNATLIMDVELVGVKPAQESK